MRMPPPLPTSSGLSHENAIERDWLIRIYTVDIAALGQRSRHSGAHTESHTARVDPRVGSGQIGSES